MGRAHEVRAKKIAQTNAAKSALYNRASKEIYLAAKSGVPDPKENLALRSAIEKWKAEHVTSDVINRAIDKAKSKDASSYTPGRYEGFGPGGVSMMVDTLTDNEKRAFAGVRAAFNHHGGKLGNSGCVSFNFSKLGVISFDSDKSVEEIEEALILNNIDVQNVDKEDGNIEVQVTPDSFDACREELVKSFNVSEFTQAEVTFVPSSEMVTLSNEDREKFNKLLDALDEIEDVQAVYHNAND